MINRRVSYATLYDHVYLSRGLALYQSVKKYSSCDFDMYVLALDNLTYDYLANNTDIKPISLEEVMEKYPVLKGLQKERTHAEFCWTLASFFTQYVLRVFKPEICVYVDSDIYFWADPCLLIDEMLFEGKSVLITEHNYYYKYDQTIMSGKFCVQFMPFVNDIGGNKVLEWWRSKCEECCSLEYDGKHCGDQKYLDDWESRFEKEVHICRNNGGGLAPWNCQKFMITKSDDGLIIKDRVSGVSKMVVFYHFHALHALANKSWDISAYDIPDDFKEYIYKSYINKLDEIESDFSAGLKMIRPDYKMINKYLFYPVPYTGEKQIWVKCDKEFESKYYIHATTVKKEKVEIVLSRMDDNTLRIIEVDDVHLFLDNLNEIIWKIQILIQFGTDNTGDILHHVLLDVKEKNHFKLEWFVDKTENIEITHPLYDKVELVELLEDKQYLSANNLYKPG